MGAKAFSPDLQAIKMTYDYAVHGGAVGTINLGNLPDGFILMSVIANAKTALTGGGTMVVGEDGSGDADGYFTDLDAIAVATPIKGSGALVNNAGAEVYHKVDSAKDGVLITIATTGYTAGKIEFMFVGVQG